MNLLISLRSEMLKTKRTAAFYFTLVAAAIIPLMFMMSALGHDLPDENQSLKDPLNAIFSESAQMVGGGILPLFVVLICTLLPQIEYRNNAWKQVLTSPQSKATVFMAKFLNIQLLIVLFLVANHLFMWLDVVLTSFVMPELDIFNRPLDGYAVLARMMNMYIVVLAISSIQFWLGLRFRNFLVPLAVGLFLWLMGTVLVLEYRAKSMGYFPYSFPCLSVFDEFKSRLTEVRLKSVGYTLMILGMGFLDFRRRSMSK